MKRFITLFVATMIAAVAIAQTESTPEADSFPPNYKGEYQLPKFKKDWAFQRYKNWVVSNIVYPQEAIDNRSEGRVVVAFIIDDDGVVRNAEAVTTPDTLLSNELIRVIKSGKWFSPAKQWDKERQRYKAVSMRSVIPITFYLPAEKESSNDHLTYGMMKSSFSGF